MRSNIAGATACVAILLLAASASAASPIDDMAGYWSGAGSVLLSNGKTEKVKCSVVYKIADGGTQIKQSMRCASADYSINAAADLKVKGAQVTGSWEERTYSAAGEVSGKYTGTAFTLAIKGGTFSASMNVSLSNCKQQINIAPQGIDVNRISIGLAKC
jgi:hypothetical protein